MIRFAQLPVGAAFHYEGARYVKVTPLLASKEDGAQRLLARAALVEPIDSSAAAVVPRSVELNRANLREALEAHHARCLAAVDETVSDGAAASRLREALSAAHADLLARVDTLVERHAE